MRKTSLSLCFLLSLFLVFASALAWTAYTTQGTRFLLAAVIRTLPPGTVEVREVWGRLGSTLRLKGLRLSLPDQEIAVDTVVLKWQPLNLPFGKVSVSALKLTGVSVLYKLPDNDTPYDLTLPEVSRWLTLVQCWIKDLTVDSFTYREPGSEPVTVDAVSMGIIWHSGVLRLQGINAAITGYGTLRGSAAVNLSRPALSLHLNMALKKPQAGIDRLSLDATLRSPRKIGQIEGPLTIRTFTGNREGFTADSHLTVERQAITLGPARVTEKGRKGTVEGAGRLDLSGLQPSFTITVKANGLDLSPEIRTAINLSGTVDIAGDTEHFSGILALRSSGGSWKDANIKGTIEGNSGGVALRDMAASFLGGTIRGAATASWAQDMTLSALLTGKGLDPAKIHEGLEGNLNFEMKGHLISPEQRPAEGSFSFTLLDSHFHKRALTGELDASWRGEMLRVKILKARGKGFSLTADGVVQERLSYEIRVDDASQLLPGSKGALSAAGWARWRRDEPAGTIRATGRNISYGGSSVSSLNVAIDVPDGYEGTVTADIAAREISYGVFSADLFTFKADGSAKDHQLNLSARKTKGRIDAAARGKYADSSWQGTIQNLSVDEARFGKLVLERPSTVEVSKRRILLSPFSLAGAGGENLSISGDINPDPAAGFFTVKWQHVNLSRAEGILPEASQLTGRTSGNLKAALRGGALMSMSGGLSATGSFSHGPVNLKAVSVTGNLDWGARGLSATFLTDLSGSGTINATASSRDPARFALPGQGAFRIIWKDIDLGLLQAVIPETVHCKGKLSGETGGNFLPGDRFDLSGRTAVAGGSFSWRSEEGEISMLTKEADMEWSWRDDSLQGKMDLRLTEGRVKSSFRIPLTARLPLKADPAGPLRASMDGELRERGLISALLPHIVQETRGQVQFYVTAQGTWNDPVIDGRVRLGNAGAYLPSIGISLKDISAEAVINKDRLEVTSFLVRSGSGHMDGTLTADLRGDTAGYRGVLKGDRFQAIYLPELQVSISPDLVFEGTTKGVSVKGSIAVPDVLVRRQQTDAVVKASPRCGDSGRPGKGKRQPALYRRCSRRGAARRPRPRQGLWTGHASFRQRCCHHKGNRQYKGVGRYFHSERLIRCIRGKARYC